MKKILISEKEYRDLVEGQYQRVILQDRCRRLEEQLQQQQATMDRLIDMMHENARETFFAMRRENGTCIRLSVPEQR